jgi:hypothetical protein
MGSATSSDIHPPLAARADACDRRRRRFRFRTAGRIIHYRHSSSKPSANDPAAPVFFILRAVNRAMRSPILLFRTVWRLSKFAAGHVRAGHVRRSDTTLLCLRKMRDLRSTIPQVIGEGEQGAVARIPNSQPREKNVSIAASLRRLKGANTN